MDDRLFRHTATLFLFIGFLDFFANKLYLYWTTWWFDMVLHFLSGGVVAMVAILFLQSISKTKGLNRREIFLVAILSACFVGFLWEVFEIYFEVTYFSDGFVYWTDTLSDLFFDLFGGFLGIKYSFRILDKNTK